MKKTLLSFAALLSLPVCLCAGPMAAPPPLPAGLTAQAPAAAEASLKDPRLAGKFESEHGARYRSDAPGLIKELAASADLAMPLTLLVGGVLLLALLSWGVYSALHMNGLHPGMSDHEVQNRAILLMMSLRMVLAYLGAGFAVLFFNSMVIDSVVHELRGEKFGLAEAFFSALARAGQILALSVMSFGAVYVLRILAEKLKMRLGGWWARTLELAVTMTEAGIMLGANYMLVVMMAEKAGLRASFEMGVGAAAMLGAATLSLLHLLEGILAVGIYFNDRGGALPGKLAPEDLAHVRAAGGTAA
jgi:hypothetical protein